MCISGTVIGAARLRLSRSRRPMRATAAPASCTNWVEIGKRLYETVFCRVISVEERAQTIDELEAHNFQVRYNPVTARAMITPTCETPSYYTAHISDGALFCS